MTIYNEVTYCSRNPNKRQQTYKEQICLGCLDHKLIRRYNVTYLTIQTGREQSLTHKRACRGYNIATYTSKYSVYRSSRATVSKLRKNFTIFSHYFYNSCKNVPDFVTPLVQKI